jgi:hypothetical protein
LGFILSSKRDLDWFSEMEPPYFSKYSYNPSLPNTYACYFIIPIFSPSSKKGVCLKIMPANTTPSDHMSTA